MQHPRASSSRESLLSPGMAGVSHSQFQREDRAKGSLGPLVTMQLGSKPGYHHAASDSFLSQTACQSSSLPSPAAPWRAHPGHLDSTGSRAHRAGERVRRADGRGVLLCVSGTSPASGFMAPQFTNTENIFSYEAQKRIDIFVRISFIKVAPMKSIFKMSNYCYS